MKNIILFFLFITLTSCSSDNDFNCSNSYNESSDIKVKKVTVTFKNQWTSGKTVFNINSDNQIISETHNTFSKDFIYNNCRQLIKRDVNYFNEPDRITENYTEYDENGLLLEHMRGNYRVSVIDNTDPNSIEVRATLAGNNQYGTNGIWKFTNNRLISDGIFNYEYLNDNLISLEIKDSGEKAMTEYYDLINPISIFKLNTFGKRNIFFYASDTFSTLYNFDQMVIDNSKNLPKKIIDFDKEASIKILNQKGNLVTNFIIEYSQSSVFLYSYEYLIEIE